MKCAGWPTAFRRGLSGDAVNCCNRSGQAKAEDQQKTRVGDARVCRDGSGIWQAADVVGMSEHQRKTAIRLSRIPDPEFEEAIEADEPPTHVGIAANLDPAIRRPRPEPGRQPGDGVGDGRVFVRPDIAPAGQDLHSAGIEPGMHSISVELDLV
jgi:hypothetical protein